MSKALSGSRLRTAALKAVGLYNRSLPVAMMDPCESSIAAAWPLLEKWRDKTGGPIQLWIAPNIHGTWRAGCSFNNGEIIGSVDLTDCASIESAMAAAICRALVAAAEKTL